MVVDLKVLDRIVDDDDPEHIKISFGESFFSSWRKYVFWRKIWLKMFFLLLLLLLRLLLLLFLLLLWGGGFAKKLYPTKGESLAKVQLKIGESSPCHI